MKAEGSDFMNVLLGARIRSLRDSKGLTQEQVADKMNCTRQKYARIEKGLIDISYASLSSIAQILGVSVDEITSAVNDVHKEQPVFRTNGANVPEDKFEYISNMIDTFYAHRKLYNSIRQVDLNE
jgi:transcriptional regulator with XRE-family HTH domain